MRFVLIALLAAVAGTACGSGVAGSGAAAGEACGSIDIQGVRCLRVDVPEDREHPERRTIGIRVAVLPARGPKPASDAVFYLAGGPGQAATSLMRNAFLVDDALREHRDLVFMDQRGTGASNTLDCEVYGPPHDLQSYFDQFLPLARVRDCGARLGATAALAQYTTAATVADLDAVRRALGYPLVNLIGVSYGTRVAMEYVRQYEDHVRAVILDGPVPPSVAMPERFGQLAQRALDGVLEDCVAEPACARAFPRIKEEAQAVIARIRRDPVRAAVRHRQSGAHGDVSVSPDNIVEAIRYMTYSSDSAARVPLYLHEAFAGNYAPLSQFLLDRRADGIFEGLYLSVTCTEDVPFLRATAEEADDPTYLGAYRVREQRAACAEWGGGRVPAWHRTAVTSTRPVLIVSGMRDPVTPPEHGDEIAKTLPNSLHLRVPAGGHSPAGLTGLQCLSTAKREFLEAADPKAVDASCIEKIARRGFALELSRR